MRAVIAIVFLCACAQGPHEVLGPSEAADAGNPDAATSIVPTDAGSVEPTDAGNTGTGDAGSAGPGDAGTPDSGLAIAPVVGADAGPISLTVAPASGSACATWLAPPSEPEMRSVQTQFRF